MMSLERYETNNERPLNRKYDENEVNEKYPILLMFLCVT